MAEGVKIFHLGYPSFRRCANRRRIAILPDYHGPQVSSHPHGLQSLVLLLLSAGSSPSFQVCTISVSAFLLRTTRSN